MLRTLLVLFLAVPVAAQWQVQQSHTTADLRGIHSIGNGIAWASGSKGTVLRTTDNGTNWQPCAIPPGAEALDFRGIQAFNAQTAIVMSSGKGELSRLYKTADACKTWKVVFTNPDPEGFWDSIKAEDEAHAFILGDSVKSSLRVWEWHDDEDLELAFHMRGTTPAEEGSFAASNSVIQIVHTPQLDPIWSYAFRWSSGVAGHAYMSFVRDEHTSSCEPCLEQRIRVDIPINDASANAGIFSFEFKDQLTGVAVGGNYGKPIDVQQTAFMTQDGGQTWLAPHTYPHGYRSAVAYDTPTNTWITVGPNGTDASTDDGRNWHALTPKPSGSPDQDKQWNALSLPFVVGPKGRIGLLRPEALAKK